MCEHSAPNNPTLASRPPHLQLLRAGEAGAVQHQQAAAAAADGAASLHHSCFAALLCAAHKQGGGCLRGDKGGWQAGRQQNESTSCGQS